MLNYIEHYVGLVLIKWDFSRPACWFHEWGLATIHRQTRSENR